MSDVYRMLLGVHVLAATLALPSFWGAMWARKGGRLHRRCGRVFALGMAVTAATAAVMCSMLMLDPLAARPPGPEISADHIEGYAAILRELGSGLFEVSLATGALLHFGLAALRRRPGGAATRGAIRRHDLAGPVAATAAGAALLGLGFDPELACLEGSGVFVGVVGALETWAVLRRRRSAAAWLVEHLVGMMGAAGIAHGAFAVNVAGLFTDDLATMFAPAGPTVLVFAVVTGWMANRWRRRAACDQLGAGAVSPRAAAA